MEGGDIDTLNQHIEHNATPTDNPHTSGDGIKPIDWEDISWGSLTAQFKRYKQQYPESDIDDLEEFSKMILSHPKKFHKKTEKRARFYLNVLLKKSQHSNIMPKHRKEMSSDEDSSSDEEEMKGKGMPHTPHMLHPALQSDLYPRIPQSFSQIYMAHPHPIAIHSGEHPIGMGMSHVHTGVEGGKLTLKSFERGAKNFFTHTLPSTLIHKALPSAIGALTTAVTDNPVVGSVVGNTLGKEAGNALGKATGYGLKKFVKGSPEAKEHMRKLREKRKPKIKGGLIPSPHSRSPITDSSLLR